MDTFFLKFRGAISELVRPLFSFEMKDEAWYEKDDLATFDKDGLYYYLFQSRELSAKALVRFGLNEIWSYELIRSDAQFSVLKGIVSSVAVFGGGALLAVSLIKLRRISSEIPKAQAEEDM